MPWKAYQPMAQRIRLIGCLLDGATMVPRAGQTLGRRIFSSLLTLPLRGPATWPAAGAAVLDRPARSDVKASSGRGGLFCLPCRDQPASFASVAASTRAPAARSAGSLRSASLWLKPSLHGVKIMPVGQ